MQLQIEVEKKKKEIVYLKAKKEQKKISPNILERFEVIKNVRFIISRLKR